MSEFINEQNSDAHTTDARTTEAFSFTGSGSEFFRIWIVNIFLTIITLGIYSAWAKVRTLSYFYGNTWLQGNAFAYLASPIAILKGRLIAVAFLIFYSVISGVMPLVGGILTLLILALLPWLISRSLRFNAINSSYRNLRFNFTGSWGDAAMAFAVWPLLGLVSFGLLFPLALHRQQEFIVGKSAFGTSSFGLSVPVSRFYKIFLVSIGIGIVGALAVAAVESLLPPLAVLIGLLVYLVIFAYFRAQLFNVTYAGISLDKHGFEPSMTTDGVAWLYFTNMLGMVCTLGLFYPWARVRTARYTAEHLNARLSGSLDQFVAAEIDRVGALGEELGEMLDLDIAL